LSQVWKNIRIRGDRGGRGCRSGVWTRLKGGGIPPPCPGTESSWGSGLGSRSPPHACCRDVGGQFGTRTGRGTEPVGLRHGAARAALSALCSSPGLEQLLSPSPLHPASPFRPLCFSTSHPGKQQHPAQGWNSGTLSKYLTFSGAYLKA